MRYVFDTNIVISALIVPGSKPDRALQLAENIGNILYSKQTLNEIFDVLKRPKISKYLMQNTAENFLMRVERSWLPVIIDITIEDCRDPKDNKFLELAIDGEANFIVSGDADLLILNPYKNVKILTANDFLLQHE